MQNHGNTISREGSFPRFQCDSGVAQLERSTPLHALAELSARARGRRLHRGTSPIDPRPQCQSSRRRFTAS